MNLSFIILRLLPFSVVKLVGNSMQPTYVANQRIIAGNTVFFQLHVSDVVIFYEPTRKAFLIKRITKIKGNQYFLEGDNKNATTDSHNFGWMKKKNILGKVIYPKKSYNS